jgi:hypothetical protein
MSHSRSNRAIWQSFLLIWALLWTPIWGQWHAIAHSDLQASSVTVRLQPGQAQDDQKVASSGDPVGHAAGSDLCKIFDHLTPSDGLNATQTAWSTSMVAVQSAIALGAVFSDHDRWSHPPARAPPALI